MEETKKLKAMIARGDETITSLSEKIGVTRVTMYTRLKKSNWKRGELAIIKNL